VALSSKKAISDRSFKEYPKTGTNLRVLDSYENVAFDDLRISRAEDPKPVVLELSLLDIGLGGIDFIGHELENV